MPTRVLKTARRTVTLNARPDRPDMRDRIYQPPLVALSPRYPDPAWISKHLPGYRKAGLILDQKAEGACTGFGLAAVINYMLYVRAARANEEVPTRVSTRMLYHLARKYDEWPGEDYEGSSCRGAMKGWFHHGVCTEKLWPYFDKKGRAIFIPPRSHWDEDAATRPVGAYYRVMGDAIADLQAAIQEVGAVYVSSDVHRGWDKVETSTRSIPTIDWKPGVKPDGGHAFALVGYDADGFIVQNSWGVDWVYHGFARLKYGDWLENGDDAWVAVMGAPMSMYSPAIILRGTHSPATSPTEPQQTSAGLVNGVDAATAAAAPGPDVWGTEVAADHSVILGNDGLPDHITIKDENAAAAVRRVCYELPKEWLKNSKAKGRRVAIYAHGGLNNLNTGLTRVRVLGPWFAANGIYPIFVVWQSGYLESVRDIVGDLINNLIAEARGRKTISLFEKASDARDYLIEKAAIPAARPVWTQMRQNATAASDGVGGMTQVATALASLAEEYDDLELHLIGHSAGSIVLGSFLEPLRAHGLRASSVSLYAPACTVAFANRTYVPAIENHVIDPARTYFDILSNDNERKDTVGPYGKSLLYLVSRALEAAHKTPILGMQAAWDSALDKEDIFTGPTPGKPNPDVVAWRKAWPGAQPRLLDDERVLEEQPQFTIRAAHGCFDNWIDGIERTMRRILGLKAAEKLAKPIRSLKGF